MRKWILKKRSIFFHIFATFFTGGIWAIIYIYCKLTSSNTVKEKTYKQYVEEYNFLGNDNLDDYIRIEKKYSKVLDQHFKNIEKINMLYTIANNLSLPNSSEMQQVINLCLDDIALAPQIYNYCKEMAIHYNQDLENHLFNYVSFQRLAIIYEKQGEYQKAIDICRQAIELGFYKDGTAGQMPGRMARLMKKLNNKNAKIENK